MRISDLLMSNNYLNSMNSSKARIERLQSQVSSGSKINKPSDSPSGTSKILKYFNKLSQSDIYTNNIQNSLAFLKDTTLALENVQSEVVKTLTYITELNNAANSQNLGAFADQIDQSLKAILDSANSQYDGKYLFGGTDFSSVPYGFTTDQGAVEVKANNVSGVQKVKISQNVLQKINLTGTEVFGTILTQNGNIDSNSLVGDIITNQLSINDAEGNSYTYTANYEKTAANTYSLTYDITDSGGASVFSSAPAAKSITFNPTSGAIVSVDGGNSFSFNIKDDSGKINFNLDLNSLKEGNNPSSVSLSANQKNDIFNTLMQIRDNLRLGIVPTEEQENIVKDFNKRILAKITDAGNITNQLYDTEELINNQRAGVEELLSKEQDVDIAKAIMELQSQDYLLQITYKLSAMFLPKSLLDYL